MKLLLDQNLSHTIITRLEPKYPGTKHVKDFTAETEEDSVVWARCKRDGYVFVTKDRDFEDATRLQGPPPKVILLLVGNTRTQLMLSVLTRNEERIKGFEKNGERMLQLK